MNDATVQDTSHSTAEDRDIVYRRILSQPNRTLEADNLAQARMKLGLDGPGEMSMRTFKSAIRHLVHPSVEKGETRRAIYSRKPHSDETKSSIRRHVWRALPPTV